MASVLWIVSLQVWSLHCFFLSQLSFCRISAAPQLPYRLLWMASNSLSLTLTFLQGARQKCSCPHTPHWSSFHGGTLGVQTFVSIPTAVTKRFVIPHPWPLLSVMNVLLPWGSSQNAALIILPFWKKQNKTFNDSCRLATSTLSTEESPKSFAFLQWSCYCNNIPSPTSLASASPSSLNTSSSFLP